MSVRGRITGPLGGMRRLRRWARARTWVAAVLLLVPVMRAVPAMASLPSPTSAAFFDSEAGDYIGAGKESTFTTVTFQGLRGGYPMFTVSSADAGSYQVWVAAPAGQPLVPGTYEAAERFDFRTAGHPGLDIFGNGRGCNGVRGRFIVDDATYDSSGNVQTFSVRFESHCEGSNPALFGALTYKSTADYRTRSVTPSSLNMNASVGSSSSQQITITNHGPSPLTPSGFTISGANASDFSVDGTTCNGAVAPAASCTVSVKFAPTVVRASTATLTFTDELAPIGPPGQPASAGTGRDIALTGSSVPPPAPAATLSSTSVPFGDVRVGDLSDESDVTLTNTGNAPLTVKDMGIDNEDEFGLGTDCLTPRADGGADPKVLQPNARCTIALVAAPVRMGGRSGVVSIVDDAANSPQTIALTAAGTEGYYLVRANGATAQFGDADAIGNRPATTPPVVSAAPTVSGDGVWVTGADGAVANLGDAKSFGSLAGKTLNRPIVGITGTPDSEGYWMVATDGGIFSFGNASFFGSTGAIKLNQPIVGMASTPTGKGYWLVASDGGIFAYGDAKFFGSTGAIKLNKPIVGMTPTASGNGYWMVASDGGIFAFGDAKFFGSTGSIKLARPIVGMATSPTGSGYWLVANDGGIFAFGDVPFFGSLGGKGLSDVVAIAPTAQPFELS